jgi:hypothetical protein
MSSVNPNRVAMIFAALYGGWHLLWSALVAVSWAQPVLNFVFWMHFLKPAFVVGPFDIGTAVVLIAVTTAIGGVLGWILAVLWNLIHK